MNSILVGLFLVLQILSNSGVSGDGDIMCYQCAWSNTLSDPNSDSMCRTENFDVKNAEKISCPHGCRVSKMYESDPDAVITPAGSQTSATLNNPSGKNSEKNGDPDNSYPNPKVPLTFILRDCSDKKKTKEICERKNFSGMHSEECFCLSDLCNGENGSLGLWNERTGVLWILPFIVIGLPAFLVNFISASGFD